MAALDAVADDPAVPDDVNQPVDPAEPETTPVQLTTTEEAKKWARRGLSDYYDHVRTGEDAIAAEATANANRAKAALRAAQQRLMQDPYAPSQSELNQRQGAALMTPGNNNINGLRAYYMELANQQQAERERQQGLAGQAVGYDTQQQSINEKLSTLKQKLVEAQEKNASAIAKQSLQTLGRGIGKDTSMGGTKPLSPEGKQALDELGPDAVFTDPDTGKTDFTPLFHKRVGELVGAKVEDAHARAGTDATEPDPATRAKVADDAGIPATIASPFDGMSTKERTQAKRIEAQHATTDFAKMPDQDRQISDMMAQIDHFLELNQRTHTGPELAGLGLPGVSAGPHGASVHGGEGWNLNPILAIRKFNPDIQDMDKITQNLVTTMQKPGFSRVTNFDLQTFQKGMMGIDKPLQVNRDISTPLKVFGKDAIDYHQFVQDYYQVHGTRQGAESQWHDYLNHNPIFDPAHPGSFKLNPNRMPYQDYFRAKNRGVNFKSVELPPSLTVEAAEHAKSVPAEAPAGPHASGIINRAPIPAPQTDALLPPGLPRGMMPQAKNDPSPPHSYDASAPPLRAPAWQPDDEVPAHADGGSIGDRLKALRQKTLVGQPGVDTRPIMQDPGVQSPDQAAALERLKALMQQGIVGTGPIQQKAEGGEVDDSGEVSDMLAALRTGATLHTSQGQENRHSPATNYFGEAAGGAGTVAALLALARLRGRLGRGAAAVGRYAAENPNKAAIGAGAGIGAASGAAGSSPGDSGEYGAAYGLTGAAIAPLAALGGRGAARSLYSLGERLRGLPAISAGDRRTTGAIERDLSRAGSGANWQDLTSAVRDDRRLGVPSTIADMPEMTSSRGLTRAALTKDTPAGRDFSDDLKARQGQANDRVGDAVNTALAPDPYLQQTDHLKEQLYKNASPMYDAAYKAFPQVQSPTLFSIMNTPAGNEAAKRAFIKMQNKQRPIGQVNPQTGLVDKPSLEYLDNVKRALDDMIIREEGSGATYQPTDDGQILRGMREKLRNELDAATALPNGQPGPYQQARQQYAGDLEVLDALRSGREDFKGLSPEALQQKVAGMSFAEKDAYRSGVAEFLFRQLGSRGENPNVNPAAKILNNPDIADKVGALFDNPRAATRFMSTLQRESEMFDTSKPLITTATKGQEQAMSPASLTSLARSKLMTEKTANDISANMSVQATDPQAMDNINRLRAAADRLRSRDTLANQAGVAVGAGAAGAAVPSNINVPQEEQQ
jgi:hypothetical protein